MNSYATVENKFKKTKLYRNSLSHIYGLYISKSLSSASNIDT